MKKRSKQLETLVTEANEFFIANNVKDEHNSDLFRFVCNKLLKNKCYNGFNFYKWKYTKYVDGVEVNCERYKVLAGTANPEEYDFIQIW